MTALKSYMDGKELKFKVIIGRKTFKGFKTPTEALQKGIEIAANEDFRANQLLTGKPFERQVGIIFGAQVRDQYFGQPT